MELDNHPSLIKWNIPISICTSLYISMKIQTPAMPVR